MKNIWMYWEGPEKNRPEYINLCIRSVDRHKGNLQLNFLNENTIKDFLPNLRPEWSELKRPAHRADYIRTRLAYQYGGMWLDCDMVAIADIEPLFDFPDKFDYACQGIGGSIGCFIARKNCKVLEEVIEAQDGVLDNDHLNFGWNDLGNNLLRKFGNNYEYFQWEKWTLDEIAGGKNSKLFSKKEKFENNVDKNAVIFHLCNEDTGPLIKKYVKDKKLLTSSMLISQIFRKALAIDGPETYHDSFWRKFLKKIG